jgi:hypothetical protein
MSELFKDVLEQKQIDKPEWLRLPKPYERCRFTQLSRPSLEELCIPSERNDFRPPVRSLLLRKKGAQRGIRLVSYDSLISYLKKLEAENCGDPLSASHSKFRKDSVNGDG